MITLYVNLGDIEKGEIKGLLSEMLFEIEKGKRRVNDNAFYDEKLLKIEGVKRRK